MKLIDSNAVVYLCKAVWKYSKGNHRNIICYGSMFAAANGIIVFCQPLLWAKMINTLQMEGITEDNFYNLFLWLLAALFASNLLFWIFHGPARLLERINAFRARVNYRGFLLKGVLGQPLSWHTEHHSGDTNDKIEKGTSGLYTASAESFEMIQVAFQLIGSFTMLVYFFPISMPIVLGLASVMVWIVVRFDRVIIGNYRELNRMENAIAESTFDAITNVATIIVLRAEKLVFDSIMAHARAPYALYVSTTKLNELKWFCTQLCASLMAVTVVGIYLYQHIGTQGGVLLGTFYLLQQYLERANDQLRDFNNMYSETLQRRARVANAEELSKNFATTDSPEGRLPHDWQKIEVRNVGFSYQSSSGYRHLDGVSFEIERGRNTAFLGLSGHGKSTMLKGIRGLYEMEGEVWLDGELLPLGFRSISGSVALALQHPDLFATTFRQNIDFGAGHKAVRNCADIACFTDVAMKLEKGFDTSVKEKGVSLSGGEQQRLALARALLPSDEMQIILLDEPFSSVDSVNKLKIMRQLLAKFAGKTMIFSTHDYNLIHLFDYFCVFENGTMVAKGTLEEISLHPTFQKLMKDYAEHSLVTS